MSAGSGWSSTWNSAAAGLSGAGDLLDQRQVIEVRPERPDLALAEVGHGDAGQLDVPPGCFQSAISAEHERPGVIGFDEQRLLPKMPADACQGRGGVITGWWSTGSCSGPAPGARGGTCR
jgi:hypothetical protein